MKILGIDPGSIRLGWCVLEDGKPAKSGVLKAVAGWSADRRFTYLAAEMSDLLALYEPDVVALEKAFVGKFASAVISLSEIRGMCKCLALQAGCKIANYEPREVKQAVHSGRAGKADVIAMVRAILALDHEPTSDEADACAVALCHQNQVYYSNAVQQAAAKEV